MELKDVIFELLQKEAAELKEQGFASPPGINAHDRYESEECIREQYAGNQKYSEIKKLEKLISQNAKIKDIYEEIPGWTDIINRLAEKEMKLLDKVNDSYKAVLLESLKTKVTVLEQGKSLKEKVVQKVARRSNSMDYLDR